MKKDIIIPKIENIHIAIVLEYNTVFKVNDWNVYLINERLEPLEMILIVSKGFNNKDKTSTMRHKLDVLPAKTFAKIEFMQDEVLKLNNQFLVTFFVDNKMYEKTFLVKKNTVNPKSLKQIDILYMKGVLIK